MDRVVFGSGSIGVGEDPGDALDHNAVGARRLGSGDEVGGAFAAEPCVGGRVVLAEVREFVQDQVGRGLGDHAGQPGRVVDVDDRGGGAEPGEKVGAVRPPGGGGHLVAVGGEFRDQAGAEDAGPAGEEDPH